MRISRAQAGLVLALGLLLSVPGQASAASWQLDPAHSSIQFSVRHMMISHVKGTFSKFSGDVKLNPLQPEAGRIRFEVDVSSVDTGNSKRDEHLRQGDFFDATNHPRATFVSSRIEQQSPGKLLLVGDLTIRGVTRQVTFAVQGFDRVIEDPFGSFRAGGTATATINRKDFGVAWNKQLESGGLLIGEEVELTIDLELIKQREGPAAKR